MSNRQTALRPKNIASDKQEFSGQYGDWLILCVYVCVCELSRSDDDI